MLVFFNFRFGPGIVCFQRDFFFFNSPGKLQNEIVSGIYSYNSLPTQPEGFFIRNKRKNVLFYLQCTDLGTR